MQRVGLYDRELIAEGTTFVAMNLGYNYVPEHENSNFDTFASLFNTYQYWASVGIKTKSCKWINTVYYKKGYILPYYTPCKIGTLKVIEDSKCKFNLLKTGDYNVISIGSRCSDVEWVQEIRRKTGKSEENLFDAATYNNSCIFGPKTKEEREKMREVPFAASWGCGSHKIDIYIRASSTSEGIVRSIKHCVERGNMLMVSPQFVFPNTVNGLALVNMNKINNFPALKEGIV